MRIFMLGLRGFPGVQGGVETHAEHLCPLLVELGCEVEVAVRSPYMPAAADSWRGVRYRRLWAPRSKGLEAIVHSLLAVLSAAWRRPDVVHIQAIGPALVTPLARLMGLKVVVTHHGPDYDRQKWGWFARTMLQLGERFGMRCSNERIVISRTIAELVRARHHRNSVRIPNGVDLPVLPDTQGALETFGLVKGKYVLLVSRLVPEKRHFDLIEGFFKAGLPGWKLVLVGASDHPDDYVRRVQYTVSENDDVVMTGFQSGLALRELFTHAGVFVLPSSHEGLPIAMLEALSYGLPVVASDIPANVEVGLGEEHYFPLGDVDALANRLQHWARTGLDEPVRQSRRRWVAERYSWAEVARRTAEVYRQVMP